MFGNSDNTTDLMLPILLDMANLIRRAVRSGKEPREVKLPYEPAPPQLLRRSFTEDTELDDDMGVETLPPITRNRRIFPRNYTNKTNTANRVQDTIHKEIHNVTNAKDDVSTYDDDSNIVVDVATSGIDVSHYGRIFVVGIKCQVFYKGKTIFPRSTQQLVNR